MSLRIALFDTTCHVPECHRNKAVVVDRLARSRFPRDLAGHLGPSLGRQPSIVRIRRLSVRVILPASDFTEDALSLAWSQAFGKALFTALACPATAGPVEIFRADSVAAFIASAICDLLNGTAATQWQYAEFEDFFKRGATQAALGLLSEWPLQTLPVLLELAQHGVLARLLARFDEVAMERLFTILAHPDDAASARLSLGSLLVAGRLALVRPPEKLAALRTRAYALTLFVEAHRMSKHVLSPRELFHALLAIAVLIDPTTSWQDALRMHAVAASFPSSVKALFERLRNHSEEEWQCSHSSGIRGASDLQNGGLSLPVTSSRSREQILEWNRLRSSMAAQLNLPAPPLAASEVRWISTEWCGLFFLVSTLARLGWIAEWKQLAVFQTGGVACLVAGLALTIAEQFNPSVPMLDPGIALFAGYAGDPDLAHLRGVFQHTPRAVRLRVLESAIGQPPVDSAAESWAETLDRLAVFLVEAFATRIRGFRQATRRTVLQSFIARPGRLRIERSRIVVFPAPNPFHVAVHLSGLDAPVEADRWIGGLAISFELGDL
ncbi:MAG: hypothetical protein JO340_03670 [Acidobacteriaceae bacterium]|nr:hypothetical protein [Acidobacteriaceae bacterium]